MSWFDRVEQACAAFVERTFAKTFPSDLEPAQIARKLVAVMEARSRGEEGHLFAPGSYVVGMHGDDYERLEPHRSYLEREWSELLREMGARVGIRYEGEPRVSMVPKDGVPRGAVEVSVAGDPGAPAERFEPRGAPVRRYHLRLLKGVSAEDVYPLRPGETMTVGRSTECDVALRDPAVSRIHAFIEMDGAWPVVRDRGSTNGTFVNGKRIDQLRLGDGDVLKLGNTQLRLEVADR
jgi:hypothetical protein